MLPWLATAKPDIWGVPIGNIAAAVVPGRSSETAQITDFAANGRMAEWFKAPVLKTGRGSAPSWVRIPLLPPICSPLPAASPAPPGKAPEWNPIWREELDAAVLCSQRMSLGLITVSGTEETAHCFGGAIKTMRVNFHEGPDLMSSSSLSARVVSVGVGYYVEKEISSTVSLVVFLAMFFCELRGVVDCRHPGDGRQFEERARGAGATGDRESRTSRLAGSRGRPRLSASRAGCVVRSSCVRGAQPAPRTQAASRSRRRQKNAPPGAGQFCPAAVAPDPGLRDWANHEAWYLQPLFPSSRPDLQLSTPSLRSRSPTILRRFGAIR